MKCIASFELLQTSNLKIFFLDKYVANLVVLDRSSVEDKIAASGNQEEAAMPYFQSTDASTLDDQLFRCFRGPVSLLRKRR